MNPALAIGFSKKLGNTSQGKRVGKSGRCKLVFLGLCFQVSWKTQVASREDFFIFEFILPGQ